LNPGVPASLIAGTVLHVAQLHPSGRTIPSALITVATPAPTTDQRWRSAGSSQVHSPPALLSGFHSASPREGIPPGFTARLAGTRFGGYYS